MNRVRSSLIRGIAILGIFITLTIAVEVAIPYTLQHSNYLHIDIRAIQQNAISFEGQNVSSSATLSSISSNESSSTAITTEGILLVFPLVANPSVEGNRVVFRGTSWIYTNNSIHIHEFYKHDASSSLIRSIPGILIFIVLFFTYFSIDLKQFAFVKRRG